MRPRCIEPAPGPIDAALSATPSKSWTHRALVVAALARGRSRIERPLDAADTRRTREGLEALGARVDDAPGAWIVEGSAGAVAGGGAIACGASGTTARFLTAVGALGAAPSRIDGDERLRARPIGPLVEALRSLGARCDGPSGRLPLVVGGVRPRGGRVAVPGEASSQFASALLLAGSATAEGVELTVLPPRASFGYLLLTIEALARVGVHVERLGEATFRVAPQVADGRVMSIEGDHSSASYPLLAAAITGGRVRMRGLDPASLQPDARFLRDLAEVGCTVSSSADGVVVTGPQRLVAFDWDLSDAPDLAPAAAVLALFARGTSRLRGVANLRLKESDRVTALARGVEALGARTRVTADALAIEPPAAGPRGAEVEVAGDHRIAMAFAVAGLRVPGVAVTDGSVVSKSYPDFWNDFAELVAGPQN